MAVVVPMMNDERARQGSRRTHMVSDVLQFGRDQHDAGGVGCDDFPNAIGAPADGDDDDGLGNGPHVYGGLPDADSTVDQDRGKTTSSQCFSIPHQGASGLLRDAAVGSNPQIAIASGNQNEASPRITGLVEQRVPTANAHDLVGIGARRKEQGSNREKPLHVHAPVGMLV